jgi:integrase
MKERETGKRRSGRPKKPDKPKTYDPTRIKYLTPEQLEKLWKVMDKNKRDKTMFRLMYAFGLRVSELVNLKLEDILWDSQQIRVPRVKSGVPRVWDVPDKLFKLLKQWVREREKLDNAKENPYLFITEYSGKSSPIDRNTVQWLFRHFVKKAGIGNWNTFSVHSLRHSLGVHLASDPAVPLEYIKQRLGHKSILSTQIYMDLVGRERKEIDRKIEQNGTLRL